MSDSNDSHTHEDGGHHQHHNHHHGDHDADHTHRAWPARLIDGLLHHTHDHSVAVHDPLISTTRGIRALQISLVGLLITACLQVVVVLISGSVALLADTLHNFSDALTALPLWLAFALARRPRTRRYTYGFGRAEDLAGVLIVLIILGSALLVFYESIDKMLHPQPVTHLAWVAVAAIIGFLGNEAVALFRIRVGREIGSAALVADGLHARTDGFTSLGVLAGATGVWLGFPLADPLAGFIIGIVILVITWSAMKDMWYRMMDAVEPEAIDQVEKTAAAVPGVLDVQDIRLRWVGHKQRGELHITVDCRLPTMESHLIAEEVRHALFHQVPNLVEMVVHVDPCECDGAVEYHPAAHHTVFGK